MNFKIEEFEFKALDWLIEELNLVLQFYDIKERFSKTIAKAPYSTMKGEKCVYLNFGKRKARVFYFVKAEDFDEESDCIAMYSSFCEWSYGANLYHEFLRSITDRTNKADALNKIHSLFCKFYNKSKTIVEVEGFEYVMEPVKGLDSFKSKNKCPDSLLWKITIV